MIPSVDRYNLETLSNTKRPNVRHPLGQHYLRQHYLHQHYLRQHYLGRRTHYLRQHYLRCRIQSGQRFDIRWANTTWANTTCANTTWANTTCANTTWAVEHKAAKGSTSAAYHVPHHTVHHGDNRHAAQLAHRCVFPIFAGPRRPLNIRLLTEGSIQSDCL